MNDPKISVIIPVYNVEDYLDECLGSCLSQDFSGAEFICVNDGSTDSSAEVLEKYAGSAVIITKENGGLSSARNAGLSAARGEWVMFLDSDDRLKEGALGTLWNHIEQAGRSGPCPDIIAFGADTFPADIESEEWYKKTLQFPAASYSAFTPDVLFKERGATPFVWRQAFRRELIELSGVTFDETLKYGEDVQFQMEIFPQASGFDFIPDILYSYRLKREGSIMDSVADDPEQTVEKHYEMIRHIASFWKEKGWFELYGADFLSWVLKFTLLKVKALPKNARREKAAEMFDDIIGTYGLAGYKKFMDVKGKLMWAAFSAFGKM